MKLLFFAFCLTIADGVSAEPANKSDAPWDTLVAKLQIIESMKEPDSVKAILTEKLFSEYDLTEHDYGKFYDRFLKEPPEQQVEFLERVEDIILEMMKQQQQRMRREY